MLSLCSLTYVLFDTMIDDKYTNESTVYNYHLHVFDYCLLSLQAKIVFERNVDFLFGN